MLATVCANTHAFPQTCLNIILCVSCILFATFFCSKITVIKAYTYIHQCIISEHLDIVERNKSTGLGLFYFQEQQTTINCQHRITYDRPLPWKRIVLKATGHIIYIDSE